ncbi:MULTISPECIES: hypothetical protein [Paenibacillus]|uniref:Sporulation protein n=1 Tax=Paenibacillus ottowii TaxID=2315729 RepID=A0ABY3B841_9BACL|nr:MULTISPECIES: hypothetical protein [Paenibacillus]KZE65350.1 hypothetical protein AV545_05330 [Paenibacillus jamilae]NEU28265.1 hypothetical protein [Paenibacillus polymyxa]OBA05712.1 hypothetical protein A9P44_13485 [Paenibacillus polymyxa]TQS00311.1 hypothetical protein FKV70_05905 [Paenibacillus ottowii]
MKTSSFFLGIVLGAVASSLISRNRNMLGFSMDMGGNKGGNLVQKARTKMMDAAFPGMGDISLNTQNTHRDHEHRSQHEHHSQTDKSAYNTQTAKSKEENMRLIKEFISSSPDVKREVEQILKETHTAVPGL